RPIRLFGPHVVLLLEQQKTLLTLPFSIATFIKTRRDLSFCQSAFLTACQSSSNSSPDSYRQEWIFMMRIMSKSIQVGPG
ncbi:hypothetical protein LINPERHAP1_LOCUS4257, partial [Linum perenne]